MNELRELEIDSTLWTTPSKIINLLDFKPEKLSTETKNNSNNSLIEKNNKFYLELSLNHCLYEI